MPVLHRFPARCLLLSFWIVLLASCAGSGQADEEPSGPTRADYDETQPRLLPDRETAMRLFFERIQYPSELICTDIEETVVLQFVVSKQGMVEDLKAVRSPHLALSQAAIKAVGETFWFQPGTKDGKPVAVRMTLPIQFEDSQDCPQER